MRRTHLTIAACVLAACWTAPAAFADTTITQTLPPGGTISTGSDATPSDPFQIQVTSSQGGTFSFERVDLPSRPQGENYVWGGSEWRLTVPAGQQQFSITYLFDKSIAPLPGNVLNGHTTRDATVTGCTTIVGSSTHGCARDSVGGDTSGVTGRTLPDGDAELTVPQAGYNGSNPGQIVFDGGHVEWYVENFNHAQELGAVLSKGFQVTLGSTLWLTQKVTIAVSNGVARKLHLHGDVIGEGTIDGPKGYVKLKPAFKKAIRRYKTVDVSVTLELRDEDGVRREVMRRNTTLARHSELG